MASGKDPVFVEGDVQESAARLAVAAPRASRLPTPLKPRAEGVSVPVVSLAQAIGAAPVARERTPLERVMAVVGVKGATVEVGEGEVASGGAADAAFAARSAYLVELCRALGAELGLEDLRGVVRTTARERVLSVVRDDRLAHVRGEKDVDFAAVLRALTPERAGGEK